LIDLSEAELGDSLFKHSIIFSVVLSVCKKHAVVGVSQTVPRVLRVSHVANLVEVKHRRNTIGILVTFCPVTFRSIISVFHWFGYSINRVSSVVRPSVYRSTFRHIVAAS
jgi:hypothetical protein